MKTTNYYILELFLKYMRMYFNIFNNLLIILEDKLTKVDTLMRESLHPELKLAAVLGYFFL